MHNPRDPLLYLQSCIAALLPGGSHAHLAPPYKWDGLLDVESSDALIRGNSAARPKSNQMLDGGDDRRPDERRRRSGGGSASGRGSFFRTECATPETSSINRGGAGARKKLTSLRKPPMTTNNSSSSSSNNFGTLQRKSRAVGRKFTGQYRRYQVNKPEGFPVQQTSSTLPYDSSPVKFLIKGVDDGNIPMTHHGSGNRSNRVDGVVADDGNDLPSNCGGGGGRMMQTLAKSETNPENLHELFAAFIAGTSDLPLSLPLDESY